jgi:hypothetical protein
MDLIVNPKVKIVGAHSLTYSTLRLEGCVRTIGWGLGRLTRFSTARTWGKPPPSPLYYTLCLAMGPTPKCHFVPGLSN